MEEQDAIARLKRGDIQGLEPLVRLYQVQAVRVAYLITRDRQIAEDVVQEAFIQVYQAIERFDDHRPFGPWFMRLVVNRALKRVTQTSREISLEALEIGDDGFRSLVEILADPQPGPEEVLEQTTVQEQVWEAMGRLSPAQRAAMVLRYYLGFSEHEIAVRLGCTEGTVKRHLHNARQRLRQWLYFLVEGSQ